MPSFSASSISQEWAGIFSRDSRQETLTFLTPHLKAVRATSRATLPPPRTMVVFPTATFLPKATSRRKSVLIRTSGKSEPGIGIILPADVPVAIKTAWYPSWKRISMLLTRLFVFNLIPSVKILAISHSNLSLGSRKAGMPTVIMPPAKGSASNTVTL